MTNRERILETINQATGPICDDCLTNRIGLPQRQQAYQRCSELEQDGLIRRGQGTCTICAKVKKVNWRLDSPPRQVAAASQVSTPVAEDRPWHWEGHVQKKIVTHLTREGYTIIRTADTASKEAGKDIVAVSPNGRELWVSVKGFPAPRGSTNVQARHWFSHAIFDMVLYRGENQRVDLAIGLPAGYTTYQSLSERVRWFRQSLPFRIFWVGSDGSVKAE